MTDNEIKREQPSFEVRAESLKKRTKEFFSTYENPNGSEDRLEICLIREGYRAVLTAEKQINRQKANAEGLTNAVKYLSEELTSAKAEIERLQKENDVLIETYTKCQIAIIKGSIERIKQIVCDHCHPDFNKDGKPINVWDAVNGYKAIDNFFKETVGEG